MRPLSPSWLRWPVLAAWLVVAVWVAALYGHFAVDDFFITYRYAQNLVAGDGFAFNPGERVFGVTEPAQVLALAALHRLTGISIPLLGTLVTAAGLIGLAWTVAAEERARGREPEALLGGTLVVLLTLFWGCRGAGVMPGLALLAWAAVAHARLPRLAGLAAGCALWFRPELGLGIALIAVLAWLRERRIPWRFGLAAAGVVALGAAACWLYFGRVTPITLGAKQLFAAWDPAGRASGRHFWPGFLPLLERHWGEHRWLFLALAGAGLPSLFRRAGAALACLAGLGVALALAYPLLGVPLFAWYVIPCVVAVLYGYAFAVGAALRWLAGRLESWSAGRRRLALALPLVLLTLPMVPLVRSLSFAITHPVEPGQFTSYRDAGRWIRQHSEPGQRVAALEVGTLAYFADRPVVDLLGLVSPSSLEHVRERNVIEALRREPTDFFVLTSGLEGLIGPVRTLPWFVERYEQAHSLPGEEGQEVWIFRRTGRNGS
ncbi:MAG TPA: hypothetical protein VF017_13325 [Thermoanaerobaculia bacterium]|nr:hypothetical protein [Thermoanaerobaculia bacterium]